MSKRYFFTLSEAQNELFESYLKDGPFPDATAFITAMLADEKKRREAEASRRGVGRPRNDELDIPDGEDIGIDYTDDVPKNIPHFGRMIGQKEYADIQKRALEFAEHNYGK